MTKRVREVLSQIEDVLIKRDQDAQDLMSILTALRGPDDEGRRTEDKDRFTIPIRRNAFPRMVTADLAYGKRYFSTNGTGILPNAESHYMDDHFTTHAKMAVEALKREDPKPPEPPKNHVGCGGGY